MARRRWGCCVVPVIACSPTLSRSGPQKTWPLWHPCWPAWPATWSPRASDLERVLEGVRWGHRGGRRRIGRQRAGTDGGRGAGRHLGVSPGGGARREPYGRRELGRASGRERGCHYV